MKTNLIGGTKLIKKPIFKWAWEKLNPGDYNDIKSYKEAMKEYLIR